MKSLITLIISLIIGFVIWQVDSQPNWDDTGITVALILIGTGSISLIRPHRPFICAFGVCIWIPVYEIITHGNYATVLVFLFGFIGAYGGSTLRTLFSK